MSFLIVMGAMNPKLGEIVIINDNNDFPKGIRLISIFGTNMAYKHMPFCDTCCLLYISFFSIPSYSGKNLYLSLILLRDCSYYYEDRSLKRIKPENKIQKNNIYRFERHGVTFWLKNENVIFNRYGSDEPETWGNHYN